MKTLIILEEKIFGFNVIMYRDKYPNGEKKYRVVSGLHVLDYLRGIMCVTSDYNKAFDVYRNAVSEIVDNEIAGYKKEHGYK